MSERTRGFEMSIGNTEKGAVETIFPLPAPLSFSCDTNLFDFTSGFAIARPTSLRSPTLLPLLIAGLLRHLSGIMSFNRGSSVEDPNFPIKFDSGRSRSTLFDRGPVFPKSHSISDLVSNAG